MKSPSKEQGYSQKTQINKDRYSQIAASQHPRNSSRSASTSFRRHRPYRGGETNSSPRRSHTISIG